MPFRRSLLAGMTPVDFRQTKYSSGEGFGAELREVFT